MTKFLTTEETAESLNVCVDTVRRWLRDGTLRGRKLGKTWRIPESELIALGQCEAPASNTAAAAEVANH